jgi:hypothetical protein
MQIYLGDSLINTFNEVLCVSPYNMFNLPARGLPAGTGYSFLPSYK